MKTHTYIMPIVLVLLIAGCANIGPNVVQRDRSSYNQAIADSWKEQTLLNIVRLRYLDMPVFLDVASIVSGYTMETAVNAGGVFPKDAPNIFSLGSAGKFTDRPTITYMPVNGAEFSRKFMTPIPPDAILFLMQAGWPVDLILPVTVESVNGLRGRVSGGMNARPGDSGYKRVVTLLREVQKSGVVGMRVVDGERGDQKTALLFHRDRLSPEIEASLIDLSTLLHLRPGIREVDICYGQINPEDNQIALLTRSMLQIMLELSAQINVPDDHVSEGRSVPSMSQQGQLDDGSGRLIEIHSGSQKPENAFVMAKYRDYWFWIDDRDLFSKRTFTFAMLLFSLTETGGKEALPLVTIPTG